MGKVAPAGRAQGADVGWALGDSASSREPSRPSLSRQRAQVRLRGPRETQALPLASAPPCLGWGDPEGAQGVGGPCLKPPRSHDSRRVASPSRPLREEKELLPTPDLRGGSCLAPPGNLAWGPPRSPRHRSAPPAAGSASEWLAGSSRLCPCPHPTAEPEALPVGRDRGRGRLAITQGAQTGRGGTAGPPGLGGGRTLALGPQVAVSPRSWPLPQPGRRACRRDPSVPLPRWHLLQACPVGRLQTINPLLSPPHTGLPGPGCPPRGSPLHPGPPALGPSRGKGRRFLGPLGRERWRPGAAWVSLGKGWQVRAPRGRAGTGCRHGPEAGAAAQLA